MDDFSLKISPNIVLGTHMSERLGSFVSEWGTKYMLIMDPVLKEYGVSEKIETFLKDGNIEYFVFNDIPSAPDSKVLEQALVLARGARVHGVIAVGGTKAANIGRAIAALYNESQNIYDFIDGAQPYSGSLPFIFVATSMRDTFMFSERSPIIDARSRKIKMLKLQNSLTKLVVLDANLSSTLTEKQRISLGMEMLCMAIEGYLSTRASFFSDTFAEKAFDLIVMAIEDSLALSVSSTPDLLLIQGGCLASLCTGISSPGVISGLAAVLNAREKLSRATISTILFPCFIEEMQHIKTQRLALAARKINAAAKDFSDEEAIAVLAEHLRMRIAQAGLPSRLKELGVSLDTLGIVAQEAAQLDYMNYSAKPMNADELFSILKKAF